MQLDPQVSLGTRDVWLIVASVLSGLITTVAMLWKTSYDQRYQIEMRRLQYQADREDREAKARDVAAMLAASAVEVRDRMEATANRLQDKVDTTARDVRGRVEATAKDVRDRLETGVVSVSAGAAIALDAQTRDLHNHIESAKAYTADKADAAYHEANSVNVKLAKLHEAHDRQGRILEQLLETIRSAGVNVAGGSSAPGSGSDLAVVAVPSGNKGEMAVVAVNAAAATMPPAGAGRAPVDE